MMKRTARGFELIAHSLRRMKSFFSIKPRSRRITFSFIPRCVIQHETTATGTMLVHARSFTPIYYLASRVPVKAGTRYNYTRYYLRVQGGGEYEPCYAYQRR